MVFCGFAASEAGVLAQDLRPRKRHQGSEDCREYGFPCFGYHSLLVDLVTVGRLQRAGDGTDRCDLVCRHRSRDQMHVKERVGYWPTTVSHQSGERCSARTGFGYYFCADGARICKWSQRRHCLSEIHSLTLRE